MVRRAYASCIFTPRVQPEISGLHSSFQHPKSIQPTFLQFPPCLLSILIYKSINPFLHFQLVTSYPWRPPLHIPDAAVSIRTPGHLYGPAPSYIYVHPFPNLILLFPLHDPASYTRFPPPLPGELGNPPARRARAHLAPPLACPS